MVKIIMRFYMEHPCNLVIFHPNLSPQAFQNNWSLETLNIHMNILCTKEIKFKWHFINNSKNLKQNMA